MERQRIVIETELKDCPRHVRIGAKRARPSYFRERLTLADGQEIGRAGAGWYFLDRAGLPISDGWHEIQMVEPHRRYRCSLGKIECMVRVEWD